RDLLVPRRRRREHPALGHAHRGAAGRDCDADAPAAARRQGQEHMRRRAFALAASVLVAAVALGWSGVSAADAPDRVGWRYALNQNGLAVPGPPTVPDGGLYLAQGTNDNPGS